MKEQDNIPEILKNLKLASKEPGGPYQVPEGYFEALEARFSAAVQEDETPILSQLKSGDAIRQPVRVPYSLPAGYFDKLEQQLLLKVAAPTVKGARRRRLFYRIAAAAAVLVIGGWLVIYPPFGEDQPAQPLANAEGQLQEINSDELLGFAGETAAQLPQLASRQEKPSEDYFKDISSTDLQRFLEEPGPEYSETNTETDEIN